MVELRAEFDQERDKLVLFLIKNGNTKDPKVVVPAALVKNIKLMKDDKREALLRRYFLKCTRYQSKRFF